MSNPSVRLQPVQRPFSADPGLRPKPAASDPPVVLHGPDLPCLSEAAAAPRQPHAHSWPGHAGRALLYTGLAVVGLGAATVGTLKVAEGVVLMQQATVEAACDRTPSTFPMGTCPAPSLFRLAPATR